MTKTAKTTATDRRRGSMRLVVALTIVSSLLVAVAPAGATPPDVEWTQQFGTDAGDRALGMATGPDGSIYVVGATEGDLAGKVGDMDAFIRKYTPDGAVVWTRQFAVGGPETWATSVAVALDGSVYVVGSTGHILSGGSQGGFVRKYTPTGSIEWTDQYPTAGDRTMGSDIAVGPDGAIYAVGSTEDDLAGKIAPDDILDAYIRRYTPEGIVDWTRQFGTTDPDTANAVAIRPDGTVAVAGERTMTEAPPTVSAGYVRVFDGAGITQWSRQFGSLGENSARGVAATSDGSILVSGYTQHGLVEPSVGDVDGFVRLYAADGVVTWTHQFGTPGGVTLSGTVTVGPTGLMYAVGWSEGDLVAGGHAGTTSAFVRALDADGTARWTDQFGSEGSSNLSAVAAVSNGGLFVAGSTQGNLAAPLGGTRDAIVRRYAAERDIVRLAGANRFETAAAVAAHHHPSGADTVFVATGSNFPDALAGAAGAGLVGSPLLLTGSLPPATETALEELDPFDIVVLGGPAAVSVGDAALLGSYGTVERLFGMNRYETAVAISQWAYPSAGIADAVIVATGENFPDALSAAAAAVALGGPVLLTPTDSLPQTVAAEIGRLAPDQILVAGGTAAVSGVVFDQLAALAPTTRVAGADRYATAVAISQHAFPNPMTVSRVYLAVGTNFPDALAGAAAAAALGAPVLLTPTASLPQAVADEILRLDPAAVYILGGTAVIGQAVQDQVAALIGL